MRRCWWVCVVMMMVLTQVDGQVAENFGDGELHHNPEWMGDTGSFSVNYLKELQLTALLEGEAGISTGNVLLDSTEWLFRIRLGFSPSSNNFARVYLVSDTFVFNGSVNGYYLQFGETGSQDALMLFRQEGSVHTMVCRGESGAIAQAFDLRIRVTRSSEGTWDLYLRNDWEPSFRHQATGTDALITSTRYFGLLCRYTSSNTQNFWFDDIYVQHIYKDVQPPVVSSLAVLDAYNICLTADEALHPTPALDPENYVLLPDNREPVEVRWGNGQQNQVILVFGQAFQNPGHYRLEIGSWCDTSGNCSNSLSDSMIYVRARRWDVMITELMADPDPPPYGLPAVEYIELHNRSVYPVCLEGWKLQIGSSTHVLKKDTLHPGEYLLLTNHTEAWPFAVRIQQIKSLSLPNTGAELALWDELGAPVAWMEYQVSWWDDPFKLDGGWALEMIDRQQAWLGAMNWDESKDPSGGTPGRMNSVSGISDDSIAPYIAYVALDDPHNLTLAFSEPMDPGTIEKLGLARLEADDKAPLHVAIDEPSCRKARLYFETPFPPDLIHTLLIPAGIMDPSGNVLTEERVQFGDAQQAIEGEVVINEVLFNPWPDGVDFVELYNRGSRCIDLRTLRLCGLDADNGTVKSSIAITTLPYSILPGAYCVLSTDGNAVRKQYPYTPSKSLMPGISSFPSLPDDKGGVGLALYTGEMLDRMLYQKSMHSPLLTNQEGVSLERLNAGVSGLITTNWHSAAASVGYASPGLPNSHNIGTEISMIDFQLSPKEISPDNDGFQDILFIHLRPEKPGTLANLWIFNAVGQVEKALCRALSLAGETTLSWDGYREDQRPCGSGLYIALLEVMCEDGSSTRRKEVFYIVDY